MAPWLQLDLNTGQSTACWRAQDPRQRRLSQTLGPGEDLGAQALRHLRREGGMEGGRDGGREGNGEWEGGRDRWVGGWVGGWVG